MTLISKTYTFTVGDTIVASEHNTNYDTLYNDYNGSITNANIKSNAAIADSKLAQLTTAGKVSGAAITSLTSVPSGAGVIPAANLPEYSLLDEQVSAPSTAANQGAVYSKNDGTQTELYFREESDGDEVQLTYSGTIPIAAEDGQVAHGATIPLISGYTEGQSKWIVSIGSGAVTGSHPDGVYYSCSANGTRTVTAQAIAIGAGSGANVTANYLLIGVK